MLKEEAMLSRRRREKIEGEAEEEAVFMKPGRASRSKRTARCLRAAGATEPGRRWDREPNVKRW